MIRAVVFDMDGLMFNTEEIYFEVGSSVLRRRGCEFTRELSDAMMGRPPRAAFEVMIEWHSLSDSWEQLSVESEEDFVVLLRQHLATMPGLMELLAALERAGLRKAICTSSSRPLVDECLARFNLPPRFEFILAANDIVQGKPHPEIYLKAAARLGIAPAEMLVLEDSENGCKAAAAAGAFTVAVPGEHSCKQCFDVATERIASLADPRLYTLLGLAAPQAD